MRREMERLFDEFFAPPRRRRRWWPVAEEGVLVPTVDMYDRKGEIVVRAELPGVKKEDIELTITKDTLTIKAEVKRTEEVAEEDYYVRERSFGTFSRTLALPVEVDSERAKASFKDGVLEVLLPKREEARPKEIKVEIG